MTLFVEEEVVINPIEKCWTYSPAGAQMTSSPTSNNHTSSVIVQWLVWLVWLVMQIVSIPTYHQSDLPPSCEAWDFRTVLGPFILRAHTFPRVDKLDSCVEVVNCEGKMVLVSNQ